MSTENENVRPEVVTALLGIDFQQTLSDEDREILWNATEAERRRVREMYRSMFFGDMVSALSCREWQAMTAAWSVLARWWPQPVLWDKNLGQVLKVMPPDEAREVVRWLRWGGLTEVEPPAEGGQRW